MNSNEKELEDKFQRLLSDHINELGLSNEYSIVREPVLRQYTSDKRFRNYRPDFIIQKGNYPYLIVEIIDDLTKKITRDYIQTSAFMLELTGADYFIITNLEDSVIIGDTEFEASKTYKFQTIYSYFNNELTDSVIRSTRKQIVSYIKEEILPIVELRIKPSYLGPSFDKLLNDPELEDKIAYNKEGRFFQFRTNTDDGLEDFEHQIFQALLDSITDEAVCRYTTQDSLFAMLTNKSYRMGSHLAMNDRGEMDYVDKYLKINYKPLHSLTLPELHQMNQSFISSCTTISKEDDLTMYRLYGDDTKGVCLKFALTLGVQSKSLIIRKISYARPDGSHPELDAISFFIDGLSASLGIKFRFIYLDIWKHFFKTKDYAIEDEVRVLYLNDGAFAPVSQGWVITHPDKITAKYVVFDLNAHAFPLHLTNITLGPNFPDPLVNRRQLEVLLDEEGFTGVNVVNSKIESYRKS